HVAVVHCDAGQLERRRRGVLGGHGHTFRPCTDRFAVAIRRFETLRWITRSRASEASSRIPVTTVAQYGWMPRMVSPLAMVARISAPTRTRGSEPRPPVRATPASATAVSALKMMPGLASGVASVVTAVVRSPPSAAHRPETTKPSTLYRALW